MITDRIKQEIRPGTVIPKPETTRPYEVKGWGCRRGRPALIYKIPPRAAGRKPAEKGVTDQEFESAYEVLNSSGEFTRVWFNENLPRCAKEGSCNFTTIGGIFALLDVARYLERGVYLKAV